MGEGDSEETERVYVRPIGARVAGRATLRGDGAASGVRLSVRHLRPEVDGSKCGCRRPRTILSRKTRTQYRT